MELEPTSKLNALQIAIRFSIWNNVIGDYLEFGAYEGNSLVFVYYYYREMLGKYINRFQSIDPDHDFFKHRRKYWVFDSFEGNPVTADNDIPIHWQGLAYHCSEEDFRKLVSAQGVDFTDIEIVRGYYKDSLNDVIADKIKRAAIVNIDCDLYESAAAALEFVTSLVVNGTVIYFDDWFYFKGNPAKGEQRAFYEWLCKNKDFRVSELACFYPAKCFIINRD